MAPDHKMGGQGSENEGAVRHVFLIGAKSVGQYGGYETFVDQLLAYHDGVEGIQYHVACKASGEGAMDETKLKGVTDRVTDRRGNVVRFRYHGADVVKFRVPKIGPLVAVYYDLKAFDRAIRYAKKNKLTSPVFYVMTCRIGPFIAGFKRRVKALGGQYFVNPDGHEWLRSKWSKPVRAYWKASEKQMIRHADLVIADSEAIEAYVKETYRVYAPETTYISYGSETVKSVLEDDDPKLLRWFREHGLSSGDYYLIVGRFVPENNFETMLREFMKNGTAKKLAVITNENEKLAAALEEKLGFRYDPRIVFTGTLYDPELLKKVRECAYAYLHGHSVGGTNPSLLEAMGSTELNLLYKVAFNEEVGRDAALYWTKEEGDLSALIDRAERMTEEARAKYGQAAKERIRTAYSWQSIADRYEAVFTGDRKTGE